jgi:hypothetical protein
MQLPMLLFPYFFGASSGGVYWGSWNPAELTGYVGVAPLMLAAAALALVRHNRYAAFWAALAVFALLLVLGDGTPLAQLMYRVPVYNLFRAQARNLLELDFAVAVLAALGLQAASARALRRGALLVVGGAVLFAIVAAVAGGSIWNAYAAARVGATRGPELVAAVTAWNSPVLLVPLACALAAGAAIVAVARRPSPLRCGVLLAVQAADLFWFNIPLNTAMPAAEHVLTPPPHVVALQALLANAAPSRVALGSTGHLTTDHRHAVWGIELVNGYDPFMLSRYGELAGGIPYWGHLSLPTLPANVRFLDVLNARYLAVPVKGGASHSGLFQQLGGRQALDFALAVPRPITAVETVTYLAHAAHVEQGAAVARVTLWDSAGASKELLLRAGEHTAEWSWDRLAQQVRHMRPPDAYSATAARLGGNGFRGVLLLDQPFAATRVRIQSLRPGGIVAVDEVVLKDQAGQMRPLTLVDLMRADGERWQVRQETFLFAVLENRAARPRAWLVGRTTALPAADVLQAVRSGRLPDGRSFDPAVEALVESGESIDRGPLAPGAQVEVVSRGPNTIELASAAATPSFLVVSEVFYPGWRAYVDGTEVPIVRTDYLLRGIALPAGPHRIRMEYQPASFRIGAAISGATIAVLVAIGAWRWRRKRQPQMNTDRHR